MKHHLPRTVRLTDTRRAHVIHYRVIDFNDGECWYELRKITFPGKFKGVNALLWVPSNDEHTPALALAQLESCRASFQRATGCQNLERLEPFGRFLSVPLAISRTIRQCAAPFHRLLL